MRSRFSRPAPATPGTPSYFCPGQHPDHDAVGGDSRRGRFGVPGAGSNAHARLRSSTGTPRYFPPFTLSRAAVTRPAPSRTSRPLVSSAHSWNGQAVRVGPASPRWAAALSLSRISCGLAGMEKRKAAILEAAPGKSADPIIKVIGSVCEVEGEFRILLCSIGESLGPTWKNRAAGVLSLRMSANRLHSAAIPQMF